MIKRKHLEIQLSQHIQGFQSPKVELEQYQTSPRVAANLLYWAHHQGNISGKSVIDLCAGTGILGLGATLLEADHVILVEIDPSVRSLLEVNQLKMKVDVEIIIADALEWKPEADFDTVVMNPPFGIQQKKQRDLDFVKHAASFARHIYSIHDGSPANVEKLPKLFADLDLQVMGHYVEQFPLPHSFSFHQDTKKIQEVVVFHIQSY